MAVAFTRSMLERGTDIYELVVDSLDDHAVILLDTDESVLRWSKGAERITGYDSNSVVGQRFSALDLPLGAAARADALKEAREHGHYHHEGWWQRPDGKRFWIDEVMAPLIDHGELIGFVDIARDRTADKLSADLQLAEELGPGAGVAIDNARLYREAQEANRSKADFLAIVSHELRTPLNAIMGYSDILDAGISGEVSENQRRQISRIRTSARHLTQIIEEILSYARLESGGLEIEADTTTIRTLAEEAVAIGEPVALGKGLTIDTVLSDPDQTLVTDSAKARQVLLNLLSNAIKFTDRGKIELRTFVEGNNAVYAIRDTGIGMSSDQMDRIFDPFWQIERPTTRRAGGTGLGLSVARRFAHLLGGTINVESTRNLGSTFTLRLPLSPTAAESKKRG